MGINLRPALRVSGFVLALASFYATGGWAQGQSPAPAKPLPSSSAHWSYYEPPPPPPPAAKAAPKTQKSGSTVLSGSQSSGNQLRTAVAMQSGGTGGSSTQSQVVSVPGINGGSTNLVDQQTETVQINADTTRTITRTYGQDADGQRQLIAVEQTDQTDLGGGKSKEVSTLSQRDANGNLEAVRRTEGNTAPAGPDATRTSITVFTQGMYGQMSVAQKSEEIQRTSQDQSETTRIDQVPDGNGGWMTSKKTDTAVRQDAEGQQVQDTKILAPDANGNLSIAQRQVTRDWRAKDGQEHQEVSTYGQAPAGTLTQQGGDLVLTSRETTVKLTGADGTVKTSEQTERSSAVTPGEPMQITGSVIEVDSPTKAGALSVQRTVLTDDGNGQLREVSVFGGHAPQVAPEPAATAGTKKSVENHERKKSETAPKKAAADKPQS